MNQPNTKNRILDAAEKLFAVHGFTKTSLRAVTGEAEVNLAAVNYYFGSKDRLFESIIERRLIPLNEQRLKMLDEVCTNMDKLSLYDVISSFIKPTLELLNKDEQKRYFVQLVGRIRVEQNGIEKEIFQRYMKPVFPPFITCIQELKPHLSIQKIIWGLHLSIGTTIHCIHLFCSPNHFMNPEFAVDLVTMEKMLIGFVTAGLEATYA